MLLMKLAPCILFLSILSRKVQHFHLILWSPLPTMPDSSMAMLRLPFPDLSSDNLIG